MNNYTSRSEIKEIFKKFDIKLDYSFSNNNEIIEILENIKNCKECERPDAFIETEKYAYGIEHFQVSQYKTIKKNQDISKVANGSKKHRDKIKNDREFNLEPNLDNLIYSISRSLETHSQSFEYYRNHIENIINEKEYKLIIFIEDTTESEYIVKDKSSDTSSINPLELKEIANILLNYRDSIFAILYSYGNEKQKILSGCTLTEIKEKLDQGVLVDKSLYRPFQTQKTMLVSKDGQSDRNYTTIQLYDHI